MKAILTGKFVALTAISEKKTGLKIHDSFHTKKLDKVEQTKHKLSEGNKKIDEIESLHDPTDCSPPGSSVHGVLQARGLEGAAIAFSITERAI